jgi:putative Ca2+/H+ antiporter (TMEM165/GDT1 family)
MPALPGRLRALVSKGDQMDWRVFLTTFGVIFLAEMGDKTQLAAMTMAAETKKPWAVLIGASLALACVSAIGVVVGGTLGHYLPIIWIKRAAAVAFIVIGVLILMGKF